MNKLFTLLAAGAVALSSSAVQLTVSPHAGILLPDGNVLFNNPDPGWLEDGEVWISGSVTIGADEDVAVDVTATLTSGVEKYGICFTSCVPVAVGGSTGTSATITPASPLLMSVEPAGMFSEPWTPDVIRTYVIDVNVASGGETLKNFSIIVTNDENASVNSVVADSSAFTISGRYVYWNLDKAPGVMTIYTPDGRVADQKRLSAASGSTSLSLPAGLYIWATPTHSGKILLRD
ncbi:MAG: hypothetical protein K2L39_03140 [Muribaculaceae bacterium]|nr:hypothetical protein [Muribaculaceae bacterium]